MDDKQSGNGSQRFMTPSGGTAVSSQCYQTPELAQHLASHVEMMRSLYAPAAVATDKSSLSV